jgi:hypothetical protein
MRDGRLVTPYQKTFFFLNAIKYVTTALLVLSFQGGAAATQLKIVIAAASFVYDNFFLAIVASILMGVSNEFASATHCSRHRHDCQSHCSVARIGPTTRAGQESAAIGPEIAATETTEWEQRHPTVSLEIDRR